MSFSINTNVASLQAENYLTQTSNFQSKTISEVTSGLRIVNSGDDAAGLAIANGDRSTEAVLTQGLQNATNGQNQLQIADGGMSSIGSLLDTARSLATESASGTFTGDRGVLNTEFQSVLGEINRQAQAIGLNQGGSLATNLSVFIGGGQSSNGVSAATNGSVGVDLSQATVDAKSLGLEGVQASGKTGTDIGDGSTTSVAAILANTTNQASINNNTTNFSVTGPGFSNTSGGNTIDLAVNLNGVTDANTLVTAVNAAIQAAGNGNSQQATAFKNANITAAINVDASGKSQLTFNSASTAFQVQGGDKVATALMGNFSGTMVGNVANVNATGAAFGVTAAQTVGFNITGAGLTGTQGAINVTTTAAESIANVVSGINTAIAANSALAATGITATTNTAGTAIQFTGKAGQSFQVAASGDVGNTLGFGTYGASATSFTAGAAVTTSKTQGLEISLNGGSTIELAPITGGTTEVAQLSNLNKAFSANAALSAAGITAVDNGGNVEIQSTNGTSFRMNTVGGTGDAFGFGASVGVTSLGTTASAYAANDSVDSAGAQQAQNATGNGVYQFTGLTNHGDAQTITLSAVDATGAQHTLNVNLNTTNASTLDQAVSTINSAIAASNDSTLAQIGAFKQEGTAGNTQNIEGMSFMSAGGAFKISLGASPASSVAGVSAGLADPASGASGGAVFTSIANGTGSTADISNIATATAAVSALATSVSKLGTAQAAVGNGENSLTYAINLASSQLTNLAASESSIRDANMATESANLTKSQIQLQAGIAALSQANSAPQQILTLLQH
ncbi:MAG TPA: flagellin [Bryobacteraceae bacterium]|jgi:flagellin|nr:flagellin [Bryobacteraceae bacterium]